MKPLWFNGTACDCKLLATIMGSTLVQDFFLFGRSGNKTICLCLPCHNVNLNKKLLYTLLVKIDYSRNTVFYGRNINTYFAINVKQAIMFWVLKLYVNMVIIIVYTVVIVNDVSIIKVNSENRLPIVANRTCLPKQVQNRSLCGRINIMFAVEMFPRLNGILLEDHDHI